MIIHQPDGNHIRVPADMQRKIKALGEDPKHQDAVKYIVYVIGRRHSRTSFFIGQPHSAELTAFLEGNRYVGETIGRIIERPIEEDPIQEEPPARTATEQVRRRNRLK